MSKKIKFLAVAISIAFTLMQNASAANFINNRIAFQGLLQQSTKAAIPDGTYNAQFKLHTGGTADTVVWIKSPVAITLASGIFSTSLSGLDNNSVALVPSLLDVSGADGTTSLQIDVAVDFTGGTNYTSAFNNIAIQAVPMAMIASTCMVAKSITAGALTAASFTAGDYSSVITTGTYSINISGNAATATTAGSVTGGVSVPTATNISYSGSSGNFNQSGSSGTFSTGTGTVTLNGASTIASGKSFSFAGGSSNFDQSLSTGTFATGSGAVGLNGTTTIASGKNLVFAGGASNFDQSLSSGTLATGTGNVTVNGAVTYAANKGITASVGTGAFDYSSATGVFKTTTGSVSIGGQIVSSLSAQTGINAGYTSGGSANTQTVTLAPVLSTLTTGQMVTFKAGFTNTGAMTLQVNSLAATAVKYMGQALTGGEIITGNSYTVFYDGSAYQIMSPVRLSGSAAISTGTLAANTTALNATTIAVTGTVAGDVCKCTPSATPPVNYSWNCYTGAGVVSIIQSCGNGASACGVWTTPTFKCQVFK